MVNSYAMDVYRVHDLSIMMKTSSGDIINMDFSNEQSLSVSHSEDGNSTQDSLSFSSMQSFSYSIESNGIDAQDQKEIDEFMKIAQPFIDDFLKELDNASPTSPVNKIAHDVASVFEPTKQRDKNSKNYIKTNIVEMFDNSLKESQNIEEIFKDMQVLLEKTLQEFEEFNKNLYA